MITGTKQGEIVTEIVDGVIYIHGIGLHPFLPTRARATWTKRRTQREFAERLASIYVVEPKVILVDYHSTGRIWEVRSTFRL